MGIIYFYEIILRCTSIHFFEPRGWKQRFPGCQRLCGYDRLNQVNDESNPQG